jgi:hypothetical protein
MKWVIYLTLISFFGFIILFIKAINETKKEPEKGNVLYPDEDEKVFSEFEDNEHSPLNLDVDKTLKRLSLQKQLNKIEEEREREKESFDFNNKKYEK